MTPDAVDLADPGLYFNRELSLLEFQARVLAQARDESQPLLERLRFLCICSTNFDEFFEIRVAGLKQQVAAGVDERQGADGLDPEELLERISARAHELVEEQYECLNGELLPALSDEGIRLLARGEWSEAEREWSRDFFRREVLPVLTPMGLDPAHPFPKIQNKGLNFVVSLEGTDAFGRRSGTAVVQVPRSLERVIRMPGAQDEEGLKFALLSSVIHAHIDELFPGMRVTGCHQFRLTRDSELWVDEEEVDDLLHALRGELPSRNYGDAVRLEVSSTCPEDMVGFLLTQFELGPDDLYQVRGPVNLHRIAAVYGKVKRPELKFPPFRPARPDDLGSGRDPFAAIAQRDVLLHHPYQSFAPVLELLEQAASDPAVLAIKQTLYRTGTDSPVVEALLRAARAGVEVTVVIELRARFDEAKNIDLATRLDEAGVNVVYGVVGYKTHAKLLMIVRREGDRLRRYVHLGTGNYHAGTARAYTDLGFLTCRDDVGEDVHKLFLQLTGLGRATQLEKLLQAPFTLHSGLIERIEAEAEAAAAGRESRIIAKMNSLTDPRIVRALYRASAAGVPIDLIVRGACCLRPGVPGVSDTIRVRSIVGRFLEHSRVYFFHAGGERALYSSSADWMQRNFFRRVEGAFPIEQADLHERVFEECLALSLRDDCQAWTLGTDGRYERLVPAGERVSAQEELLARLSGLMPAERDGDPDAPRAGEAVGGAAARDEADPGLRLVDPAERRRRRGGEAV